MTNLKFEKLYNLSIFGLKWNGSHPDVVKDWRWALEAGLKYASFTITAVSLAYSLIVVDIKRGVLTDICKTAVFLILWFDLTAKYFVVLWFKDHLTTLTRKTQEYFDAADSLPEEDQAVVTKYAHTGRWVMKIWFLWTWFTCCLFPSKAIFMSLYSAYIGQFKVVYWHDYTFPSPINELKYNLEVFVVIFGYHMFYGVCVSMMFVGFHPLGPIFILNACAQLELLAKDISTIFMASPYNYENVSRKIAMIMKKFERIYGYVELINNVYEVINEFGLKSSAFMTPVALYASLESFKQGEMGLDYAALIITCTLVTYIPCYYSDLLMDKGEEVRQALYASGWEQHPDPRARRSLLIMLTVAMRPISIRTVFRTVCLFAFSEICQQAYTLFNFMKVAWG